MDWKEPQGRWLLARQILDHQTVARAFSACSARGEPELGGWLLEQGLIVGRTLLDLRAAVGPELPSSGNPPTPEALEKTDKLPDEETLAAATREAGGGPGREPLDKTIVLPDEQQLAEDAARASSATVPAQEAIDKTLVLPEESAPRSPLQRTATLAEGPDLADPASIGLGRTTVLPEEEVAGAGKARSEDRVAVPDIGDLSGLDDTVANLAEPSAGADEADDVVEVPNLGDLSDLDDTVANRKPGPPTAAQPAFSTVADTVANPLPAAVEGTTVDAAAGAQFLGAQSADDVGALLGEAIEELEAAAARVLFEPGARIRDYVILEEISRGAMGVVYLARRDDGVEHALKFLLTENAPESEQERFRREVAALIRIKHPNVVGIHDFGLEGGRLYYAMDFIEGVDLKTLIQDAVRRTGEPPDRAFMLEVFRDLGDALVAVHAAGIVHRDLKPQNVLIDEASGRAVLADFGILKQSQEGSGAGLTRTGEVVGTPLYMSPEQFAPSRYPDGTTDRTDVWGFAVTLFEALTGEPPFDAETVVDLYRKIVLEPIEDFAPRLEGVSEPIQAAIAGALAREPQERLSMAEVVELMAADGAGASSTRWIPRLAALLAALVVIAGLIVALTPGEPVLHVADAVPELTGESELELRGRIENPRGSLTLSGRPVALDEDGRFRARATLVRGRNSLQLRLFEGDRTLLRRSFEVVSDQAPPEIRLLRKAVEGRIELDQAGVLRGTIEDTSQVTLTALGKSVPIQRGRFEVVVPDAVAPVSVELIARDAVGRVARLTVAVLTAAGRARREQRERLLAIRTQVSQQADAAEKARGERREVARVELRRLAESLGLSADDRARLAWLATPSAWRKATDEQREAALGCAAGVLGSPFERLDSGRFETRDGGLVIARFRHRRSGLIFHLIPGGVRQVTVWKRPETLMEVQRLRDLQRSFPSAEALAASVALEPYAGFINQWCKRLGVVRTTQAETVALREADRADRLEVYWQSCLRLAHDILASPSKEQRLREGLAKTIATFERQIEHRRLTIYVPPMLVMPTELTRADARRLGADAEMPDFYGVMPSSNNPAAPVSRMVWRSLAGLADKLGDGLRLPTLTEWRHAAMAGTLEGSPGRPGMTAFARAVHTSDALVTPVQPVPKHRDACNGFGLSDTVGNAPEFCSFDVALWRRAFGTEPPGIYRTAACLAGASSWTVPALQSAWRVDIVARESTRSVGGGRLVRPLR